MSKQCSYCKYAKQDYTGNWHCILTTCIVKGLGENND